MKTIAKTSVEGSKNHFNTFMVLKSANLVLGKGR